jgi:hypothetical protein
MAIAITLRTKNLRLPLLNELYVCGWNRITFGTVFGLGGGGVLAPLIGSLFTVISWLTGSIWHGIPVQRIGTIFLVLTIPLLLFGAHCLDLFERSRGDDSDQERGHHEEQPE